MTSVPPEPPKYTPRQEQALDTIARILAGAITRTANEERAAAERAAADRGAPQPQTDA